MVYLAIVAAPSVSIICNSYFPRPTQMTDDTGTTSFGYDPINSSDNATSATFSVALGDGQRKDLDYDLNGNLVSETIWSANI